MDLRSHKQMGPRSGYVCLVTHSVQSSGHRWPWQAGSGLRFQSSVCCCWLCRWFRRWSLVGSRWGRDHFSTLVVTRFPLSSEWHHNPGLLRRKSAWVSFHPFDPLFLSLLPATFQHKEQCSILFQRPKEHNGNKIGYRHNVFELEGTHYRSKSKMLINALFLHPDLILFLLFFQMPNC